MDKEKQIEEMCAIMADASYANCQDTPLVPDSAGICDKVACYRCKQARRLMSAGYRKASDVAREIFEEIENAHEECIHIDPSTNIGYLLQSKFELKLAELKKKYIGEDTNAPTKESESNK